MAAVSQPEGNNFFGEIGNGASSMFSGAASAGSGMLDAGSGMFDAAGSGMMDAGSGMFDSFGMPEMKMPELNMPEVAMPEVAMPDVALPEVQSYVILEFNCNYCWQVCFSVCRDSAESKLPPISCNSFCGGSWLRECLECLT